jgi:hypothetical protein
MSISERGYPLRCPLFKSMNFVTANAKEHWNQVRSRFTGPRTKSKEPGLNPISRKIVPYYTYALLSSPNDRAAFEFDAILGKLRKQGQLSG